MTRIVSIGTKLEQLDGLRDTDDLTEWEDGFVETTYFAYERAGKSTSRFSSAVVEKIEQIWARHFA